MKKILVTGGNGYIGRNITMLLNEEYEITTISRNDFDLRNTESVNNFFKNNWFDVVIHTAIVGGKRLKDDDNQVKSDNIKIYRNIRDNSKSYNKFINIGSGSELSKILTPYGLSKKMIRNSVRLNPNFYNIRIYGVFNHDELESRFIKSNLIRYINKEPMIIHKNKYMDFFYFNDLIKVLKYYIEEKNPPKEFDCCYEKKLTLNDIAKKINKCSDFNVEIKIIENDIDESYVGNYFNLGLTYEGLKKGIKDTFIKLNENKKICQT